MRMSLLTNRFNISVTFDVTVQNAAMFARFDISNCNLSNSLRKKRLFSNNYAKKSILKYQTELPQPPKDLCGNLVYFCAVFFS